MAHPFALLDYQCKKNEENWLIVHVACTIGAFCVMWELKLATHPAILYADRREFDRKRFSPPIDADTPGNFFTDRGYAALQRCSCDKIAQPDWLTLLAIHSDERRKSRERAHFANVAANLIADIWHARYRRFYTPSAAIGENRNRCTGHTWRFSPIGMSLGVAVDLRRSRRSAYKIVKCVAGFKRDGQARSTSDYPLSF